MPIFSSSHSRRARRQALALDGPLGTSSMPRGLGLGPAAWNKLRLVPRLATGQGPAGASALRGSIRLEALAMAVFFVRTAFMTTAVSPQAHGS